ncbi:MAG: hypothetical protein AAGJ82_07075 [Bacteroidota bacterium]
MLGEQALNTLRASLQPYLSLLTQAAESISVQEISNYPVFILYEQAEEPGIGLPLIAAGEDTGDLSWSVNASTLEELAAKKIVAMANVDRFREVYKTHPHDICCLVWHEQQGQFVFLPQAPSPNSK